jgi:hypothetical protein
MACEICESYCQNGCEGESQTCDVCMNVCQGACEAYCQNACEGSTQTCDVCMDACQSMCELNCQTTCESSCQDCQTGCEISCETGCEIECQATCESICQTACESSCESICEAICQTTCESTCQTTCESTCQIGCEVSNQDTCVDCEGATCQTHQDCTTIYETGDPCTSACQTGCQINCQTETQGCAVCQLCQSVCQDGCQEYCQTACEGGETTVPPPSPPTGIGGTGSSIGVIYNGGLNITVYFATGSGTVQTVLHKTWDNTYMYTNGTNFTFDVPSKGVSYNVKLASINSVGVYSEWVDAPTIFIPFRPNNFTGTLYKVDSSGNDVIDVAQWTSFATRINEFRAYKGLSQYTFNYLNNAQIGSDLMAIYFNEIINSMTGLCGNLPSVKNTGDTVYKSYFDTLINQLNSIM